MDAKISLQMVRNVIHSIATLNRRNCFVVFDKNGWLTARY